MLRAFFEARNLTDYVLSMIDDTQKCLFDSILELWVLNPLAKITTAHTDLTEFFQFDLLDDLTVVLFMVASCCLLTLLSSHIMA